MDLRHTFLSDIRVLFATNGSLIGVAVCLVFAAIGVVIALFPQKVNSLLMKSRFQLVDYSNLYIRAVGVVIASFAIVLTVLVAVFAK